MTWILMFWLFQSNIVIKNNTYPNTWRTISYNHVSDERAIVEYFNGKITIVCDEFVQERKIGFYGGAGNSSVSCVEEK